MPAKKVPSFKAEATGDQTVSSTSLKGQKYVLYFYPKDNTSGCTQEGEDFRDNYFKFKKMKVGVFGISRDSISSHEKFKDKHEFPFDLISDPEQKMCEAFDVMKMKSMYGKKYLGVERSTFLINEKGQIEKEWRNVKVPGHVKEVLSVLEGE